MQRLQLRLHIQRGAAGNEAAATEAAVQLTGMLAACGAAGGLTELGVELRGTLDVPLVLGGWAAALRQLRSLRLSTFESLHVDAPLHRLTALQSLEIEGSPTAIAERASLPPSLTRLTLGSNTDDDNEPLADALPHQVRPCRSCLLPPAHLHSVCSPTSLSAAPLPADCGPAPPGFAAPGPSRLH